MDEKLFKAGRKSSGKSEKPSQVVCQQVVQQQLLSPMTSSGAVEE